MNKSGNHGTGNAFDLTYVQHSNVDFVDADYSHRASAGLTHNRRYAGLAWATRKHLPEVGIVGSDPTHSNHIHAGRYKNGSASLLLSHYGTSWDAYLMQYACNAFMSWGLAYDGDWGSQTEAAYLELMRRLGLPATGGSSHSARSQDCRTSRTPCARRAFSRRPSSRGPGTRALPDQAEDSARRTLRACRAPLLLRRVAAVGENRETGGRILVIAVPVVGIAPSRKAVSTKARVSSGLRPSSLDDPVELGGAPGRDERLPVLVDLAG